MDLAYPPRNLRTAGTTLLLLGLVVLAAGVMLLGCSNGYPYDMRFFCGLLNAFVGTVLAAVGCCIHLLARLGRHRDPAN